MALNKTTFLQYTAKYTAMAALVYFSALMFGIVAQYYPLDTDVGFLRVKQDYIHITPWLIAFYIHVFSSMFALLAGFTQFSKTIRQRYTAIHRGIGRVYVLNIVLITGPAGFVMAFYANGGVYSRLAFGVLSVLWWWFTLQGWRSVVKGRFSDHQKYMIYSFALTLSAITLRVWKLLIAQYLQWPPMDIYRIVAWLGFVPNLAVAWWCVRRWVRHQE